jgi:hypothetical protein
VYDESRSLVLTGDVYDGFARVENRPTVFERCRIGLPSAVERRICYPIFTK